MMRWMLLSLLMVGAHSVARAYPNATPPCSTTVAGVWQADVSDRVAVQKHGRLDAAGLLALRVLTLEEHDGLVTGAERAEIHVKGFAPKDELLYKLVGFADGLRATLAGVAEDTTRTFHLQLSADGCTLTVATGEAPPTRFYRQ